MVWSDWIALVALALSVVDFLWLYIVRGRRPVFRVLIAHQSGFEGRKRHVCKVMALNRSSEPFYISSVQLVFAGKLPIEGSFSAKKIGDLNGDPIMSTPFPINLDGYQGKACLIEFWIPKDISVSERDPFSLTFDTSRGKLASSTFFLTISEFSLDLLRELRC